VNKSIADDHDEPTLPNPKVIHDGVRRLEERGGATPEEAVDTADKVTRDLIQTTAYPSVEPVHQTPEVLVGALNDLDSLLRGDLDDIHSGED
jgi:hypothetical protein